MELRGSDERRHPEAAAEEWVFAGWTAGGSLGVLSGHRLLGARAWYWAALVGRDHPLLHVSEWDVVVRADPMIVKAETLWAEHVCVAPFEQWTVGNETYAVELDDADDALGRAYGARRPIAFDLEWYATGDPEQRVDGYEQGGAIHGRIDLVAGTGRPVAVELDDAPARRWHRWGSRLDALAPAAAYAHAGLRAPFAFPDGTVADWVLTPDGWRSRARPPAPPESGSPSPGRRGGG